ncbi:MAG: HlyD family efflux transporter periplasmic adaptor subunit [Clostridiales bacterium]|nr:HlyD family efflux transporter periplasmic adaptor subunit [Clostridiales bacterium]
MSDNAVNDSRDSVVSNSELIKMQRDMRRRKKRKVIIIVLIVVVVVFVGIAVLIGLAMNAINDMLNKTYLNVEEVKVERGSLSSYVQGDGGMGLAEISYVDIRNTLEVDEVFVEEGDKVSKDTLLMTVTESSLLDAISQVQGKIDELDKSIADVSDDKISGKVKAPLDGRVKVIYAKGEDTVADTVCDNGALVVLSLDGKMACDVESAKLKTGDLVKVTDAEGNEYDGKVNRAAAGKALILVSDKTLMPDDKVTVKDVDGNKIADAQLRINKPLSVTGYTGTVKTVKCKVGDKVKAGDVLLTLSDTKISADYDSLLKQRGEQEEILNEYLTIYKEGGIFAGEEGVVKMIYDPDDTSSEEEPAESQLPSDYADYMNQDGDVALPTVEEDAEVENGYMRVAKITPDTVFAVNVNINEKDILKVKEGMDATVEIEALNNLKVEGKVTEVSDEANEKVQGSVGYYVVKIVFDKSEGMLSGMFASAKIKIESADNVLTVNKKAVHKSGSGDFVYTEYDPETRVFGGIVYVTTGLSNGDMIEIKEGLNEGDTVFYESDRSAMGDYIWGEETQEETETQADNKADDVQSMIDEHNAQIEENNGDKE